MNRLHARRSTAAALAALLLASCSGSDSTPDTEAETSATTDSAGATDTPDRDQHTGITNTAGPDMSTWTAPVPPTGEEGQPRGLTITAAEVDAHDVDQVAEAFALTMLTPDSRLDVSPSDVTRRAAQWAEPSYAEALSASRPSGGGADWLALHANDGYWSAELTPTPALANGALDVEPTDLTAERPYIATRTPHDVEQATEESFGVVVYLSRTSPGEPWAVHEFYQEGDYE